MTTDPKRLPLSLWEGPEHHSQDNGRVTEAWQRELDRDPRLRHAYTVVELVLGDGTRWRVAERILNSTTAAGTDRRHLPALLAEPDIVNDYDVGSASSSARSVQVQVPGWMVDVRARLNSGLPVAGFGEVALLTDGMRHDRRRVILRGDMTGVRFGSVHDGGFTRDNLRAAVEEQVFTCKLADPRESADAPWPGEAVDTTRWPDAHDSAVGEPYPRIYGTFNVPCLRVEQTPEVLVVGAGHDLTVLDVWHNDISVSGSFTASNAYDALGVPVTIITDISAGGITWEDGDRVYARVQAAASLPRLVDVLGEATRSIPAGPLLLNDLLLADAATKLPAGAVVSTASNDPTTLIKWVEGALLDDWPMVSMVFDAGRWGPVVTDWRASPIFDITAGGSQLGDRITDWSETPKRDVYNDFTVRWGYDPRQDSYAGVIHRNPDNDITCQASESASGPRVYKQLDLFSVPTEEAAAYIIDWLVTHYAIPSLWAEFHAPAGAFLLRRRGDTGVLTDPEFKMVGAIATIERVVYRRGQCVLGFRVWQSRLRGVAAV